MTKPRVSSSAVTTFAILEIVELVAMFAVKQMEDQGTAHLVSIEVKDAMKEIACSVV